MLADFGRLSDLASSIRGDVWLWFTTLNHEEWLVLMAVVCACGFLALLGYRSRYL
jgi:hypothetical protein